VIPRIIHFVWLGGELPEWAKRNIAEFKRLNPDYEIMMHGETSLNPKYAAAYAKCKLPCQRSDLIRYSALEQHGGWYFDVDYWPFRPLDDAVAAHMLDGKKLFITHSGRKSGLNNGVLAIGLGWSGWKVVASLVAKADIEIRNAFGPKIVNTLQKYYPALVTITTEHYWNGVDIKIAPAIYRKCINAGPKLMTRWMPETAGQLPYAMHLWAGSNGDKLSEVLHTGKPHCIVWGMSHAECYPWYTITDGMKKLGFTAENRSYGDAMTNIPDVVFLWNGLQQSTSRISDDAAKVGAQAIYMEHGFFHRQRYTQADCEGILHNASWVREIAGPAPVCGAERLAQFYPDGIRPMGNRDGYILVLGQVSGDTQMLDSEIKGPIPLQKYLYPYLGDKGHCKIARHVKVMFRPHPLTSNIVANKMHKTLPQMPVSNEVTHYKHNKRGSGLDAALDGAKFVIAINSNALVEALARGVPCMAFGPHTGIAAGVIKHTTLATLDETLKEMCNGWQPQRDQVQNYLEWLAARQWTKEEFGNPGLLQQLLDGAARIETPAVAHV